MGIWHHFSLICLCLAASGCGVPQTRIASLAESDADQSAAVAGGITFSVQANLSDLGGELRVSISDGGQQQSSKTVPLEGVSTISFSALKPATFKVVAEIVRNGVVVEKGEASNVLVVAGKNAQAKIRLEPVNSAGGIEIIIERAEPAPQPTPQPTAQPTVQPPTQPPAQAGALADPNATAETRALFARMRGLAATRLLIGQENATHEGEFMRRADGSIDWGAASSHERSDVKDICGKNPAVHGYDVAGVVGDWWLNSPDRESLAQGFRDDYRASMAKVRRRGGIVTMAWHAANPITNEGFRDGPRELWRIAPASVCARLNNVSNCGDKFEVFRKKIDVLADFFLGLKDDAGKPIPVVFRPFHENSGGWFWWGAENIDPTLYKTTFSGIWEWMVKYLTEQKGVHNLLYAISPNGHGQWNPMGKDEYLRYMPDMRYVDVLGYDLYTDDMKWALPELRMLVDLAEANKKIPAMTEGGYPSGQPEKWGAKFWSEKMLGPILADEKAKRISYFLMWFNRPSGEHYGPWPGHVSAADFKGQCDRADVLLEGEVADLYRLP